MLLFVRRMLAPNQWNNDTTNWHVSSSDERRARHIFPRAFIPLIGMLDSQKHFSDGKNEKHYHKYSPTLNGARTFAIRQIKL